MKLLIAQMAIPGESRGPMSRARALAIEARKRGHQVAFCVAEDQNYRPLGGVANFFAPLPYDAINLFKHSPTGKGTGTIRGDAGYR